MIHTSSTNLADKYRFFSMCYLSFSYFNGFPESCHRGRSFQIKQIDCHSCEKLKASSSRTAFTKPNPPRDWRGPTQQVECTDGRPQNRFLNCARSRQVRRDSPEQLGVMDGGKMAFGVSAVTNNSLIGFIKLTFPSVGIW